MTLLAPTLLFASLAHADAQSAETCIRTRIDDGYSSGLQVRSQSTATLGAGEHKVYLITLFAGTTYHIEACGDENVSNIDLVLYDADGNDLGHDASDDREPKLEYIPTVSGAFYLVVHASRLNDASKPGSVATAVTFK